MSYPFPGDSEVARARRIARAYRMAALGLDPPADVAALDTQCQGWGEVWVAPRPVRVDLDDWLSAAEAADLLAVKPDTVHALRRRGRLAGVKGAGGRWVYRARDVLAVTSVTRRRRGLSDRGGDS